MTQSSLTITGTSGRREIVDKQSDTPFSTVTISDSDVPAPNLVVTVTLSDHTQGTLFNLGIGAYDPFAGVYLVSGTAAAVTVALDALVFTPTIAPGVTESTAFTISVDDGIVPPISDATTTVSVTSTVGGPNTVALTGAPGYAASLYDTGFYWDTVYGQSGTVFLTNAQASVVGGGMHLIFQTYSSASLYETSNNWDTVTGDSATLYLVTAQASVIGSYAHISFNSASGNAVSLYDTSKGFDFVNGSDGDITLINAQAIVTGGNNRIYFSGNGTFDAVNLFFTDGQWDIVFGSYGAVTVSHAQASVVGGGDTIYFAEYQTSDNKGEAVSLYQTNGAWDTVWNSNGIVILNDAQASVLGGNENIYFSISSENEVSLYRTENAWDNIYGSNGTVTLNDSQTSIFGGGNYVYLNGGHLNAVSLYQTNGEADYVFGSNSAVILNDAKAYVSGNGNDVYLNGFTNVLAFQPEIGQATVHGFDYMDVLQFSKSDFANFDTLHPVQVGTNTVIDFDGSNVVTLIDVISSSLTAKQFSFV